MSRPTHLLLTASLLVCSLASVGCGTIYDDMYSPKRSRFVPDPVKPEAPTNVDLGPIPAGDTTPLSPGSSVAPATPAPPAAEAEATTIPGL